MIILGSQINFYCLGITFFLALHSDIIFLPKIITSALIVVSGLSPPNYYLSKRLTIPNVWACSFLKKPMDTFLSSMLCSLKWKVISINNIIYGEYTAKIIIEICIQHTGCTADPDYFRSLLFSINETRPILRVLHVMIKVMEG